MTAMVMEVLLLIVSAAVFLVSFLIPDETKKNGVVNEAAAQEKIQELLKQEVDAIRTHVDDVVKESVSYAMERTERSLERLSNEKIMAVNEYSDTVLHEIHKNHEETIFLYDMLNGKHESLKKTVTEANKAAKVVQDTMETLQFLGDVDMAEAKPAQPEKKGILSRSADRRPETPKAEKTVKSLPAGETPKKTAVKKKEQTVAKEESLPGIDASRNSNEKILELHERGKSNVAIAKELELGVGEVKLVIDLYKNM